MKSIFNWIALCFSTTLFSGFLPEMASCKSGGGVVGTFMALLFQIWALSYYHLQPMAMIWLILILFLLSILLVGPAEMFMLKKWGPRRRHTGEIADHDFNRTNVDEFVGQLIAGWPVFFFGVSLEWGLIFLVCAFFLFRFFDVKKPWIIKSAEKANAAWGIMLDDFVAGIFSAIIISLPLAIWF